MENNGKHMKIEENFLPQQLKLHILIPFTSIRYQSAYPRVHSHKKTLGIVFIWSLHFKRKNLLILYTRSKNKPHDVSIIFGA